jgi:hypothetical protein
MNTFIGDPFNPTFTLRSMTHKSLTRLLNWISWLSRLVINRTRCIIGHSLHHWIRLNERVWLRIGIGLEQRIWLRVKRRLGVYVRLGSKMGRLAYWIGNMRHIVRSLRNGREVRFWVVIGFLHYSNL